MRYKFGTLRRVHIQAWIQFVTTLVCLLFYGIVGPGTSTWVHGLIWVHLVLWTVGIFVATNRFIDHLRTLERERTEPDSSMEMVCRAAASFPIAGYVPIIACMFASTLL